MTTARQACPDWLDDVARNEWNRLICDDLIGPEHHEALAVYSFVVSLRHRVRTVEEILRTAGSEGTASAGHPGLLIVLAELEERLTRDLLDLSATLGVDDIRPFRRHQTRIFILDEGVE